jgi:hypothetical protein
MGLVVILTPSPLYPIRNCSRRGGGWRQSRYDKKNNGRIIRIATFIVFVKIISVVAVYYLYLAYGL